MYSFSQLYKQRNKEAQAVADAKKIADKKAKEEERKKKSNNITKDNATDNDKESTTLALGFKAQERQIKEMSLELRMLRSLASTGLIVSSFAHELKSLSALLVARIED